ncbi:hypothetical protein DC498_08025 [Terrimonas sp.]|uniref:hypothetical protein n=1 Tax=Terrimonas sp. TaxID=1914338 RepID=UPI000D50EE50|nr:hypothetical protein [Terrimonas sp.]PVD52862.1 hypothetical protein DC498_08025 [Terrimonas sp.]
MYKYIIIVIAFIVSCGESKRSGPEPVRQLIDSVTSETDSLIPQKTGEDTDDQGCKSSAGYQWSVIKNNCIRIFEEGVKLNPLGAAENKTAAVYIIFSKDNSKVELFLPSEKASVILERKAEGQSWHKDIWELIPWKGYVLKKNDIPVYGGM